MPKNAKQGTFGLFIIQLGAEKQNNQGGDTLETSKIPESLTMPKKMVPKGKLLPSKVGRHSEISKKWTFHCEVCGLEKKKVTVRVGHFCLTKSANKTAHESGFLESQPSGLGRFKFSTMSGKKCPYEKLSLGKTPRTN